MVMNDKEISGPMISAITELQLESRNRTIKMKSTV